MLDYIQRYQDVSPINEDLIKEREQAKTDEQEFIETLKTLKGWEWELVAKHIPFSLCLERVNKEIIRLQEFEASVKSAVKESEG